MINPRARDIITPQLREGETLLWADKPNRLPLTGASLFQLVFSFIWLLLVLLIVFGVLSSIQIMDSELLPPGLVKELAKPLVALVFYLPLAFLLIGLMLLLNSIRLLISPLFQVYAITDQRGIIATTLAPRRTISLTRRSFERMERTGGTDVGTLEIASRQGSRNLRAALYQVQLDSFHKIRDPKKVEALIHERFLSGGGR